MIESSYDTIVSLAKCTFLVIAIIGFIGVTVHFWISCIRYKEGKKQQQESIYKLPGLCYSFSDIILNCAVPFVFVFAGCLCLFLISHCWAVEYDRTPYILIEKVDEQAIPYDYHVVEQDVIEYKKKNLKGEWVEGSSRFTFSRDKKDLYLNDISKYQNIPGAVYNSCFFVGTDLHYIIMPIGSTTFIEAGVFEKIGLDSEEVDFYADNLTWKADNKDIIKMSNSTGNKIIIEAEKIGKTYINVSYPNCMPGKIYVECMSAEDYV